MKYRLSSIAVALISLSLSHSATADFSRRYIHIVGSSTVTPVLKSAAERFSQSRKQPLPLIESTGTGGGIKLFCEGVGGEFPDVVMTSRTLRKKELDACRVAGADELVTVKVANDALILAQSKGAQAMAPSRKDVRGAFAKWSVDDDGRLAANSRKTWEDVNSALPKSAISVLGPANTSSIYDALVELVSDGLCVGAPWTTGGASDLSSDMNRKCRELRTDVYKESAGSGDDMSDRLSLVGDQIAVIDFKTFDKNRGKLQAVSIDGIEPSVANIAAHRYPGARPLFVYAKAAHLSRIPGLKDFLATVASESTLSDSSIKAAGLVPLNGEERQATIADVQAATGKVAAAKEPASGKPARKGKSGKGRGAKRG